MNAGALMDGPEALLACYQDVALQLHLMRPRIADRDLIEMGWRLSYAVDSNVVGYYLEPDRHAVKRSQLRVGLGEVFRLDTLVNQQRLARRVADYPFLGLVPEVPLIALSPINGEIRALYSRHTDAFLHLEHVRQQEESGSLIERLARISLAKLGDSDRKLIEDAIALDHPIAEAAEKLHYLITNRRVLGSDLVNDRSHSPALAKALRPALSTTDMIDFAQRKGRWLELLRRADRDAGLLANRDAEALAKVEICNLRLEAEGEQERLLYLTGDHHLLKAAELFGWEDETGVTTFGAAFLRHPRAYLDEPEILRPSDSDGAVELETLSGWLTLLLDRVEKDSKISVSSGETIFNQENIDAITRVAEEDPKAAEKILSKWQGFAEALQDASLAPRSKIRHLLDALEGKEASQAIELVRHDLEQEIETTWKNVVHASSRARFALEVAAPGSAGENGPNRDLPCLVFEERPALVRFLRQAADWLADPDSYHHKSYDRLRQAVRKEDPTEYGDYIAHAFLLAQQSQWKTAGILAGLATSKAPVLDLREPRCSNGRESLYVEAYCSRLTSRSRDDLVEAQELIDRAIRIEGDERQFAADQKIDHEAVAERLKVEHAVIRLTGALYDWHSSSSLSDGREQAQLEFRQATRELRTELASLAAVVQRNLDGLEGRALGEGYDRNMIECGLVSALGRCLRSSLGIAFQLGDFDDAAKESWRRLKSLGAVKDHASHFARFVLALGTVVYDDDQTIQQRRRLLKSLQLHMPPTVMCYDAARYEAMLAMVRSQVL